MSLFGTQRIFIPVLRSKGSDGRNVYTSDHLVTNIGHFNLAYSDPNVVMGGTYIRVIT